MLVSAHRFNHGLADGVIHCLTGEEFTKEQLDGLLNHAQILKKARLSRVDALQGQHLALLFDKPSLRTRVSFTVAMRELGGDVIESVENTRKKEAPADQARVFNGYCHAIMMRTHEDRDLEILRDYATIPVINGLSNLHHPCQIFADLLTLKENFGDLSGLTISYIGDGNNILHSLLLLAPQFGIKVQYCCPQTRQPNASIVEKSMTRLQGGSIQSFATPKEAVKNAHAVYTDVWTSMGFEAQANDGLFDGFQVNEALMALADKKAVFMHCLPMVRGKEVSETLPDAPNSVIFQQSENRLHVQKALLLHCIKGE